MKYIKYAELKSILQKSENADVLTKNQICIDVQCLAKGYIDGTHKLYVGPRTIYAFFDVIHLLPVSELKTEALALLKSECPTSYAKAVLKKEKNTDTVLNGPKNPDDIEIDFCRTTLKIFYQMGLISTKKYNEISKSRDVKDIDNFLASYRNLNKDQEFEYAERFVEEYKDSIDLVPPIILARAYTVLQDKVRDGIRGTKEDLLNAVCVRIDELSAEFAMCDNPKKYRNNNKIKRLNNFINVKNIANYYDGYREMFLVRFKSLPAGTDSAIYKELANNIVKLDKTIGEYDKVWGLDNICSNEEGMEKRWAALNDLLSQTHVSNDVKKLISNYKFLDKNKKVIPQFSDEYGVSHTDFTDGCDIIPDGRLNQIIELCRHDIALAYLNKNGFVPSKNELEAELNNRVPLKLFEIDADAKAAKGLQGKSDQFSNSKYFHKFISDLGAKRKFISDVGYNMAMDAQVNQTAGFANRLQTKMAGFNKDGKTTIIPKLFKPIENIDKRANTRFFDEKANNRKVKIEFYKRIFATFANTFLVSAAITTVAGATAVIAGISLSVSVAVVGVVTGLAFAAMQIKKWQKQQQEQGKGCGIKELVADKRMLASLGTSAFAVIGMMFGAFGLKTLMAALGYTALGLGGTTNSVQIFNDAKDKGLTTAQAVSFAIGNALAVVAGGVGGRLAAKHVIDSCGLGGAESKTIEQKNEPQQLQQKEPTTHFEYKDVYANGAVENAERISNILYSDNMSELQHRVELINQYNATHGTNINTYRAIMINADAGGHVYSNHAIATDNFGGIRFTNGNVKVFGADWLAKHPEFTVTDIKNVANMFSHDGGINEEVMNIVNRLDKVVGIHNHVGAAATNIQTVNGINTYTNGDPAVITTKIEVPNQPVITTEPEPVVKEVPKNISGGMGMLGMRFMKMKNNLKRLNNRMGTLLDNMFVQKQRIA